MHAVGNNKLSSVGKPKSTRSGGSSKKSTTAANKQKSNESLVLQVHSKQHRTYEELIIIGLHELPHAGHGVSRSKLKVC